jgi:electron transfer flavoprotein alpha/beta subunit
MQILGSAKKPILNWTDSDIGASGIAPAMETVDIMGVAMSRKNLVFKDDLDESVAKLADSLSKEGLLG